MALVAAPFAIAEAGILAAEAPSIIGSIGSFITSVLSFTGASAIISDITGAIKGSGEKTLDEKQVNAMNPLKGVDKQQYKSIEDLLNKSPMMK